MQNHSFSRLHFSEAINFLKKKNNNNKKNKTNTCTLWYFVQVSVYNILETNHR